MVQVVLDESCKRLEGGQKDAARLEFIKKKKKSRNTGPLGSVVCSSKDVFGRDHSAFVLPLGE